MKKAAYIIATQYDNLGDLIINKCLIDELSQHVELYVDTVNVSKDFLKEIFGSDKVYSLNKEFGFSFKNLTVLKYLLKNHKSIEYIFRSPGPIFYQQNKGLKSRMRNTIFTLIYKKHLKNDGKSYAIGSEITFESDSLIKNFKNSQLKNHKFLLRSKDNVEYMKRMSVKNATYIPDLCFLMKDKIIETKNENRRKVGISFRDLNNEILEGKILNSVRCYVDYYLRKGYEIVFFYQVKRDLHFTKKLYLEFSPNNNTSFLENPIDFDKINIYNEFESVISNRLHVLLLGFIHNTLTFPIVDTNTKTNKIKGIYNSIESPINTFEELNIENIERIYNDIAYHKNEILNINKIQFDLCKNTIADLFV